MQSLEYNNIINKINEFFANANDTKIINFSINSMYFTIVYEPEMIDLNVFNDYIYPKIKIDNYQILDSVLPGILIPFNNFDNLSEILYSGNLILVVSNSLYTNASIYQVVITKINHRNIQPSTLDPVNLFESQEGFIEDISINTAMIRKRLKSHEITIREIKSGNISKTKIYVIGLTKNIAIILDVIAKINSLETDLTISSKNINALFQGRNIVPMTISTGSPENFCNMIVEGRVGVLIDNSPIASIVPANFAAFTSMKNEKNAPLYYSIFSRILVAFFTFVSIFMLGLVIALFTYHPSVLTVSFLSNVKLTERGTSVPIFIEILLVLILFDFYRYATSRSSSSNIQNVVVILGGLFIGQNAVLSGLVGPLILLLSAMSFLASYAITNNLHLITSFSIFRIIILISSYIFGLYGFFASSVGVITYLCKVELFNFPFFFPIAPLNTRKLKTYVKQQPKGVQKNA